MMQLWARSMGFRVGVVSLCAATVLAAIPNAEGRVTAESASADGASARRPLPDLALKTVDGTVVDVKALRGHVLLVDIWASWCAPCKAAFPQLDALHREYHARGLDVLAVNVDERRRDAEAFLQGKAPAMSVLFDPQGQAPLALKVKGMPTSFLVDRKGAIRFVHEGYSDKVVRDYKPEIEELLQEAP